MSAVEAESKPPTGMKVVSTHEGQNGPQNNTPSGEESGASDPSRRNSEIKPDNDENFVDNDNFDDDEGKNDEGGGRERRKIEIKFIQNKARRHITFSKRKHGIMKKAWELSVLTGTQVLLLVVSETGLVYTFTTPKLQPLVTQSEGKNLIQACLNAADTPGEDAPNDGESDQPANSTLPNPEAQNLAQHHAQIVAMRKRQESTHEMEVRSRPQHRSPNGSLVDGQSPQPGMPSGPPGAVPGFAPNGTAAAPPGALPNSLNPHNMPAAPQGMPNQPSGAMGNPPMAQAQAQAQAMAANGMSGPMMPQGYKLPAQYGYPGYPFNPMNQQFGLQGVPYPGQMPPTFDPMALLSMQQQQQQQQQSGQPQQQQQPQQQPAGSAQPGQPPTAVPSPVPAPQHAAQAPQVSAQSDGQYGNAPVAPVQPVGGQPVPPVQLMPIPPVQPVPAGQPAQPDGSPQVEQRKRSWMVVNGYLVWYKLLVIGYLRYQERYNHGR